MNMDELISLDQQRMERAIYVVENCMDVFSCALRFSGVNKPLRQYSQSEKSRAMQLVYAALPNVIEEEMMGQFCYIDKYLRHKLIAVMKAFISQVAA